MKKRMGVLIFVFLTGMILGTMQPAMLYGAEAPSDVWDLYLLDPKPYPGITLEGPLSIYYEYVYDEYGNQIDCGEGLGLAANMYYTVRLNKEFQWRPTLYTFQGTNGTCLNDWSEQATIIREFLGTAVQGLFPNPKSWKVKSINKAQYHDDDFSRAFVADIEIAVKK
jgi:hypothetical protein